MKRLIGITGYKRSGKDTLARGLCQELGLQQFSFADPLRSLVAEILGISLAQLEECKETPIDWLGGVTPRHMMQTVGTEWGRNMIHPELWILSMFARMPDTGGVTSDVRFPNEAQQILDRGGVVLRVNRPGYTSDGHASEIAIPDHLVTAELHNIGTPAELIEDALAVMALVGRSV